MRNSLHTDYSGLPFSCGHPSKYMYLNAKPNTQPVGTIHITTIHYFKLHLHATIPTIYHICPYTSACPNRHARPCSTKHITSNSHKIPDKTSKDRPKTLKFERYSGLFGCRACANRHFCKQRSTRFLFTIYMRIVGTRWQVLLLKLTDVHPSPNALAHCTSIRTYTVDLYLLQNKKVAHWLC